MRVAAWLAEALRRWALLRETTGLRLLRVAGLLRLLLLRVAARLLAVHRLLLAVGLLTAVRVVVRGIRHSDDP